MRSQSPNAALSRESQLNITIFSRPFDLMVPDDTMYNASVEHAQSQPTPSSSPPSIPTTHELPPHHSRRGKRSSRRARLTHRALRQHNFEEEYLLNTPSDRNYMQQQDQVRRREAAAHTLNISLPPPLHEKLTQEPNSSMPMEHFHTSFEHQQYQQQDVYPAPGNAQYGGTIATSDTYQAIGQYGQEQNFSRPDDAGHMVNYHFYPQEDNQCLGYSVPQGDDYIRGFSRNGVYVGDCEANFAEIGAQFETYTYEE